MKSRKIVILVLTLFILVPCFQSSHAEKVLWDAITSGGIVGSTSGANIVSSSIGQPEVDMLEGSNYRIYSGFWNPWLSGTVGTDFEIPFGLPTSFQLHRNYPNPFHTQTTIHYDIVSTSRVTLEIFDLLGHRVCVLTDEAHEPGYYTTKWNGQDALNRRVGSGVYFCRMRARVPGERGYSATNKLLYLK